MMPLSDDETALERGSPQFEAFARFARMTATKRELAAQLKRIEEQLDALEPVLLTYLSESGCKMISIEGFTLSPKRIPWVYPLEGVERQTVCEALKLSGLGWLVKENYSTASLTSYVEQLEEHHDLVGDTDGLKKALGPLAEVVAVKPRYILQALALSKTKTRRKAHETENQPEGETWHENQ